MTDKAHVFRIISILIQGDRILFSGGREIDIKRRGSGALGQAREEI